MGGQTEGGIGGYIWNKQKKDSWWERKAKKMGEKNTNGDEGCDRDLSRAAEAFFLFFFFENHKHMQC